MEPIIVTAPEHRYFPPRSLKVFLAGGIQKCVEWQQEVIKKFLAKNPNPRTEYKHLFLLNPRRADWLDKPGEATRQIEWEFDMLERCDIFTMYFAGGESVQPICMYELGRYIERMKTRFPNSWMDRIVITCDTDYKRLNDVLTQTKLATDGNISVYIGMTPEDAMETHYKTIFNKIEHLFGE